MRGKVSAYALQLSTEPSPESPCEAPYPTNTNMRFWIHTTLMVLHARGRCPPETVENFKNVNTRTVVVAAACLHHEAFPILLYRQESCVIGTVNSQNTENSRVRQKDKWTTLSICLRNRLHCHPSEITTQPSHLQRRSRKVPCPTTLR